MKYTKYNTGPFPIRIWLDDSEIEAIAVEQLNKANIYPTIENPFVDIDIVLEKNLSLSPEFEDYEDNILGNTTFFKDGSLRVTISRKLGEISNSKGQNLYRTTLAHEIGHAVIHRLLFIEDNLRITGVNELSKDKYAVLCRGDSERKGIRAYNGEWWEWQANRFMSAILMPKYLVIKKCSQLIQENPSFNTKQIRDLMIAFMAVNMKVSRQACEIRLSQLNVCQSDENQFELAI